jgi:hypothetical protein
VIALRGSFGEHFLPRPMASSRVDKNVSSGGSTPLPRPHDSRPLDVVKLPCIKGRGSSMVARPLLLPGAEEAACGSRPSVNTFPEGPELLDAWDNMDAAYSSIHVDRATDLSLPQPPAPCFRTEVAGSSCWHSGSTSKLTMAAADYRPDLCKPSA